MDAEALRARILDEHQRIRDLVGTTREALSQPTHAGEGRLRRCLCHLCEVFRQHLDYEDVELMPAIASAEAQEAHRKLRHSLLHLYGQVKQAPLEEWVESAPRFLRQLEQVLRYEEDVVLRSLLLAEIRPGVR